MNASDVMKYGHLWVLKHVQGFSDEEWLTPGVCGVWSVKDIIAHLASFECMLAEVLETFLGPASSPTLDRFTSERGDDFNAFQVSKREHLSPKEVLAEYSSTQAQVMSLISRIPVEKMRQPGTLPWYGLEYDLEDFVAYTFYGHKREHCAQIAVYRDTLK